jgi:hypothetical protein
LGEVFLQPGGGELGVLAEVSKAGVVEGEEVGGELGVGGAPVGAALVKGGGLPQGGVIEEEGLELLEDGGEFGGVQWG